MSPTADICRSKTNLLMYLQWYIGEVITAQSRLAITTTSITWLHRNLGFWALFCGWFISNHSIWNLMHSRHLTSKNTLRDNALQAHTQHWSIDWNPGEWCQIILQKQASKFEKQAKIGNLTEKQAQNASAGKFNKTKISKKIK